jgi:hypothetical protein
MASISWNDLRASAENGPQPLPAGTYNAAVDRVNVKETRAGKRMFGIMFRVSDGPHKGNSIWTNLVVSPESPRALGILFQQFDALGLPATYFAGDPTDDQIAADLEGQTATIAVKIGEWDGMPRPEVARITGHATTVAKAAPSGTGAGPALDATAPASPYDDEAPF